MAGDDYWNWFGELTYEPTKSTEIVLRYGYDYDDRNHEEETGEKDGKWTKISDEIIPSIPADAVSFIGTVGSAVFTV